MYIIFKSKKLKKDCEDYKRAVKRWGPSNAKKITLRLEQIKAADNFNILVEHRIGRCHQLEKNRKGQYALDLVHPHRLIIQPLIRDKDINPTDDLSLVTDILIMEVIDYHG